MGRTLFLGDLQAQYKIWKEDVLDVLPTVDSTIQLGNMVSISRFARDSKKYGRNEAILKLWSDEASRRDMTWLIGRNEIAVLNSPDSWTNSSSNAILRDAWLAPEALAKVAVVEKGRLVTHGGLTHGEWVNIGRPSTAEEAAARLQEKYANTLYQGECFALDRVPNPAANPLWADPVIELYPSWLMTKEPCPFDQVHGAETLNGYRGREAVSSKVSILHYIEAINYRKFGSVATVHGAIFTGVNPGLPTETVPSIPQGKAFYVESV